MNEIVKARSLSAKCEKEYNRKYFPNNEVMDHRGYSERYGLQTEVYNCLSDNEIWGVPYAFAYGSDGKLKVTFQEAAHTLVVGTTQVGKTWGHVMSSVYTLSGKKNKADFMITDPKGEISENTAEILKQRGYKIFAINFKDTRYSNMWNPLLEIYDCWMEMKNIEDEPLFHGTVKTLFDYTLDGDAAVYLKNKYFWSVGDRAYTEMSKAVSAIADKKADISTRTSGMVNQLVASIGASSLSTSKEPCWQMGALEILKGMIYLMLEDALDSRSGFKRENMNFMNMQRYYEIIRESVLTRLGCNPLVKTAKLAHKQFNDESIRHMRAYFENAPTTARSYLGIFENIMQEWFTPKIYSLVNDNNIDLDDSDGRPFAVFLITRDYEKSDYFIAGLFVDWVYKQMLNRAESNGGKLKKEMFFILDEFANIPLINSFASKISTGLSRRIIFQLYIQSYEQLVSNYGTSDADTIRANCNLEIFLGSQSLKTKREFSDKCGTKHIRTLDSALSPDKRVQMEIPVLSVNALESLERGEAYVKRLNRPTSKTRFEMAYNCPELAHRKVTPEELGLKSLPYNDGVYVYKYLESECSMSEFGMESEPSEKRNFFTDVI